MYPSLRQLLPAESFSTHLLWSEGLASVSILPISMVDLYHALDDELDVFGQTLEAQHLALHEIREGMACVRYVAGFPPLRCEVLRVHDHGVADLRDIDLGIYLSERITFLYLPTPSLLDLSPMSIECEYFGHSHYATLGGPLILAEVRRGQVLTAFVRSVNPDTGRPVVTLYDEQDRDVLASLLMDREWFDDPWAVDEGFSSDDSSDDSSDEEDPEPPGLL